MVESREYAYLASHWLGSAQALDEPRYSRDRVRTAGLEFSSVPKYVPRVPGTGVYVPRYREPMGTYPWIRTEWHSVLEYA